MVINYDFSQNLIEEAASFVEKNFIKEGKDLSRLAFVFGGKRPALFLKKELSQKLKKSYLPPRFFSIDEFAEYTIRKSKNFSKISDMDACHIIYKLAKEQELDILKGRESFSQFLPWAKEVLAFIEQMDVEDIKPETLKDIQSGARIGYDVPDNINAMLGGIISLRAMYHAMLKKENLLSRGLLYLSASEYVDKDDFKEFDYIIFCGFFYLSNTEIQLVNKLYDKKKAILIFQGNVKEWAVLNRVYKDLGLIPPQQARKDSKYKLNIHAGFDVHSEVCLTREILKDTEHLDKTVVVLPLPENVIPLLCEVSGQTDDFNVSMGYPLNRSSLYSLFESISKAQENLQEHGYYAKDYLSLLSHPLIKNLKAFSEPASTRILMHKIEDIILGTEKTSLGGGIFVNLKDLENLSEFYDLALKALKETEIGINWDQLKSAVSLFHQVLFAQWENVDSFYKFCCSLESILDLLINKSSLSNYPMNLKIVERIFEIKEEFYNSSFKDEKFAKDEIFKIFLSKLDSEKISFSGSPLKGLQILGLLETRSLNFENVLIMDVNEQVLPSLKIYEPLIPREVMISLGLNQIEKEEEIQRYHFKRLISSAKNVHLIYQERPDKEKSRFIEELIWDAEKSANALDAVEIPRASFKVKILPKKLAIKKTKDIIKFLEAMEYSASSVNTYLHCSLEFYYHYCLGLKEKEELLDEPESADIGTFIHELLESTFSCFINKAPRIDAKFRDMFFNALDKKFDNEFKRKMKSDSFLIKEILDVRMKRFLDNETKRGVKKIMCLEKTFSDKISLSCGIFNFKAIVDRIDLLDDLSLLVLDYKTGNTNILPQTNIDKIKEAGFTRVSIKNSIKSFQLPIYLYVVGNDKKYESSSMNAALYSIKEPGNIKMLFREEKLMQVYMQALDIVMKDILNPNLPFEADPSDIGHCNFCPFFYLCR